MPCAGVAFERCVVDYGGVVGGRCRAATDSAKRKCNDHDRFPARARGGGLSVPVSVRAFAALREFRLCEISFGYICFFCVSGDADVAVHESCSLLFVWNGRMGASLSSRTYALQLHYRLLPPLPICTAERTAYSLCTGYTDVCCLADDLLPS